MMGRKLNGSTHIAEEILRHWGLRSVFLISHTTSHGEREARLHSVTNLPLVSGLSHHTLSRAPFQKTHCDHLWLLPAGVWPPVILRCVWPTSPIFSGSAGFWRARTWRRRRTWGRRGWVGGWAGRCPRGRWTTTWSVWHCLEGDRRILDTISCYMAIVIYIQCN